METKTNEVKVSIMYFKKSKDANKPGIADKRKKDKLLFKRPEETIKSIINVYHCHPMDKELERCKAFYESEKQEALSKESYNSYVELMNYFEDEPKSYEEYVNDQERLYNTTLTLESAIKSHLESRKKSIDKLEQFWYNIGNDLSYEIISTTERKSICEL